MNSNHAAAVGFTKAAIHALAVALTSLQVLFSPDLWAQPAREAGKASTAAALASANDTSLAPMRGIIERYATDQSALERYHSIAISEARTGRLRRYCQEQLAALEAVNFDALEQEGRIDYLLLKSKLRFDLQELEHDQKRVADVAALLPFSQSIIQLEEARRRMEPMDAERGAKVLTEISEQTTNTRKDIEKQLKEKKDSSPSAPGKTAAHRAARMLDGLRETLRRWHDFYAGYDPAFTWWADQEYQKADKDLQDYTVFLRRNVAGSAVRTPDTSAAENEPRTRSERSPGGARRAVGSSGRTADALESKDDPVIGDPIGRQALLDALASEMIPYTPEELIEIANREFAWCEAEQRRAARDLGFGDDWHKALDHVSNLHVKPGEQPKLIKELAEEAVKFVEDRKLVTVPELCKETWRMEMMSPERQKVNPYFTGGEVISVSYPTATMSYEDKLMSMRGNNIPFSRATVHHEVIPGHHLQAFMSARYRTHRRIFRTPFLVEGWSLYWEMLLWDKNFPRTAADRVGMLFWRSHRCARIIFSLNFHLGKMSAPEAIDFLVERVGHERRNATAEVRRSVEGSYGPLYQAAYMLGGLQIRALRKELVESGRMTDRAFHDAILKENAIPIEMIRASLTGQPLKRDFSSQWRFYELK